MNSKGQRGAGVKVSIVIPVINESGQISQSVQRAWESGASQVIVVDGGSTDSTPEIVRELDCQLVESLPGRAIQMNAGARVATGNVVVFLHADNWLVEDGCEQIRLALSSNSKTFGGFKQVIEHPRAVYRLIAWGNGMRLKCQGLIYGDQAFFIRREDFEAIGGFPQQALMEDFEISRRLRKRKLGQPCLLMGPTFVSARRWETAGPIRQTVRNWFLSLAYRLGASPEWVSSRYRRHDK